MQPGVRGEAAFAGPLEDFPFEAPGATVNGLAGGFPPLGVH
jgi:hypothetical protein